MKPPDNFESSLTDGSRYRLLVDAVVDYAIYMLDPTGIITSWNPGAQKAKGYQEAEILGHHFSRFYTEEDRRAGLPDVALRTAANEGRFENEGWRVRKDGTRFWAHVIIDPIRTPSGQLLGFAKVTRDLSERKRAEAELKRSEEHFRLLVQSVTDYAIYMLNPEGRVSNWNQGAQRIKGYSAEEIVGEHFSRFYSEEDREAGLPQRGLESALREGRFESEGWRVRKDGTRFWANVVIDPIRDDNGTLLGFAKITRDVTEKKNAQHELERTREALFQAQKMEAIGQLSGGIAHDFNNLLMAVLGSLELVRKRLPTDSSLLPLVQNAINGAERGAALTERMLAFARRQELNPRRVDVPALVGGMKDLLARSLGPTITIRTEFPPAIEAAHADANQLELALLNLVMNARDAMPEGGPIIISAREESVAEGSSNLDPGRYICLSVTDSGEGMSEATLARAMEPFFTTKGVGKGTGLGLSMVHGLAEQSGGVLILESEEGKGTIAELWLPSAGASSGASDDATQAAEPEPEIGGRPLVVLCVDDDFLVLMNTAALVEDLGHKALEASSGSQALEILKREKHVDLVITDQAMPHMTGVQLAEAIRRDWPALPIILATGYAELPPGTDAILPKLSKPFRQQDLAQAIAQAVRTDQMKSEP